MAIDLDLHHLVMLDIPEPKPQQVSFLDVVNHQRRENTITNCYAYFLDAEQSPQISQLLIDALLQLINAKYSDSGLEKELRLLEWKTTREQQTINKKGRIDLVIESGSKKEVVIIEAKVDHLLNNDLVEYWSTYVHVEIAKKAAIILSLHPMAKNIVGDDNYINITHQEWLTKTAQNGLPHDLPIKQYIYFNDFVEHMKRITNSQEMTEEVKFYLQNAQAIDKALHTKDAAGKFVLEQIQALANSMNYELDGNGMDWQSLWDKEKNSSVYYTMLPHQIIEGQGLITILLEIGAPALEKRQECLDFMENKFVDHNKRLIGVNGDRHYQHLLCTQFNLPVDEMSHLAERAEKAINEYLKSAYDAVYEYLKKHNLHESN